MGKRENAFGKLALAAVLLLALSSFAFAGFLDDMQLRASHWPELTPPACLSSQSGNPFEEQSGWMGPTAVALAIELAVIGGVYAISGIAHTQKLRTWAKESLFAAISTAAIIGIIIASYTMLDGMGINYLKNAIVYAHTVGNTMKLDFFILMMFSLAISFLSQTPSFAVWGFGIKFSLVPVLKPIFDMLGIIMNLSIASIGEWFAQEFFLCFVKTNMLAVFFPLAIFTRAFGATKKLGDTILALSIGFLFVYPFVMNLSMQAVEDRYHVQTVDGGACTFDNRNLACIYLTPSWGALAGVGNGLTDQGWGNILHFDSMLSLLLAFFTGVGGMAVISGAFMFLLNMLQTVAYFVFVVSVILPVFNIFITITLSMEIAKALGTEIDLSAIEKLI